MMNWNNCIEELFSYKRYGNGMEIGQEHGDVVARPHVIHVQPSHNLVAWL